MELPSLSARYLTITTAGWVPRSAELYSLKTTLSQPFAEPLHQGQMQCTGYRKRPWLRLGAQGGLVRDLWMSSRKLS